MKNISFNVRTAPRRKGKISKTFLIPYSEVPETEKKLADYLWDNASRPPYKRIPDNIRDELFLMLPMRSIVYLICRDSCSDVWLCRTKPFFTLDEAKKHTGAGDCVIRKPLNLFGIRKAIKEAEREGDISPSDLKVIEKLKEVVY